MKRHERIASLMAGLETPGDLTPDERAEHREDLLCFLQEDYDACADTETQ